MNGGVSFLPLQQALEQCAIIHRSQWTSVLPSEGLESGPKSRDPAFAMHQWEALHFQVGSGGFDFRFLRFKKKITESGFYKLNTPLQRRSPAAWAQWGIEAGA